ncbi:glycoside hydrolase family 24 protein [Synechocystis sp. PCC 7509]|uniref:glycoside hydrolase family 24 protein n=1 Tax=Synechocystis sp. PCC 7509 TaxID=927677 RepID=UPI0002AC7985|nr:glycoside hydrolase family protein [Synechocystis sp. PCC 7509]
MARFLTPASVSPQVLAKALKKIIPVSIAVLLFTLLLNNLSGQQQKKSRLDPAFGYLPPLEMKGGDPYIRALMRTISASEANDPKPYSILYGGGQINDLSRHPEQCITIVSGPNRGDCSTAAGRYQMINITWYEKAALYHPEPPKIMFWQTYSFEPEFQDAVVYAWLSDRQFWGKDLSKLLQAGKLNQVRRLLSGTWTSLGYGIEDNSLTGRLPKVYQKMLKEELKNAV